MRDGGSKDDSLGLPADGPDNADGRLRFLREHRLAVSVVAFVVLAAAVTIPVVLDGSDGEQACDQVSASTRTLVDAPQAATEALDPGDDLARIGSARKLLAHSNLCGDGAQILGRLVDAATGSPAPGRPHTLAQGRAAYAVAAAVHDIDVPEGLAPGLARMVAEYVVDAGENRGWGGDALPGPAVPPQEARADAEGRTRFGRFLALNEAHAVFGYTDKSLDVDAGIESLVAELSKDPEAFAILYDAERANFAHYLERLTDNGGDPDFPPQARSDSQSVPSTAGPDSDLKEVADRIGTLMKHRARYAMDGTIPDLAAFDRSVQRHTRGAFRPAGKRQDSRPVMGDIADRPKSGPIDGDLMDGRHQLLPVLDAWAKDRGVPARRASAMKQLMDQSYVRGLWLGA
ncbi:hypothetical protein [Streptomyces sp. SM10]|uniref:hypothetical protein n=1 Tax=Streptomyces sp. SM10 TaxID=565556 RepID=UPI0011AFE008|nr:hypothetical protein [Streptomyces sp. SM10]